MKATFKRYMLYTLYIHRLSTRTLHYMPNIYDLPKSRPSRRWGMVWACISVILVNPISSIPCTLNKRASYRVLFSEVLRTGTYPVLSYE